MQARTLQTWIARRIAVRRRLEQGLHQLSAVFDGRDHETFPRRSRPVFRTAQIPILEDVESP